MAKNDQPAARAGSNQGGSPKNGKQTDAGQTTTQGSTRGLEVISTRDGFRRAGFAWSKEPTLVALDMLTDEQVDQLKNEPALTVRDVEIKADAAVSGMVAASNL